MWWVYGGRRCKREQFLPHSEYCVFPYFYEGQYKGVSTAICYMLVWSKVQNPVKTRDFVFSIPVQTNPGTHPASTTMSTGALYWE